MPTAARRRLATLGLAALLAAGLVPAVLVPVAAAAGSGTPMAPGCDGVNLRVAASTLARTAVTLGRASTVVVDGTVAGRAFRTVCGGALAGSRWVRVTAVDGRPVRDRWGVDALYAAAGVLVPAPAAPAPDATEDPYGAELTRLLNLDRAALGLPPYRVDPRLAEIARDASFACPTDASLVLRGRARDLHDRRYFGHEIRGCLIAGTRTTYRSVRLVREVFGYPGARSEILHWNAYGSHPATYRLGCDIRGRACRGGETTAPYTVALAQRSFMSSAPHRRAELNDYERVGCGAWHPAGSRRTYFACLFADGGPALDDIAPVAAVTPAAGGASPAPAAPPAVRTVMGLACDVANLRTAASTGAPLAVRLAAGARVTVTGTAGGGAWSTACPGAKAGGAWYRITEIDGRAVRATHGVDALWAAAGVLAPLPAQVVTAACDRVNLRTAPATTAAIARKVDRGARLTLGGTADGAAWSTTCPAAASGRAWREVTAIDGRAVTGGALWVAAGVVAGG